MGRAIWSKGSPRRGRQSCGAATPRCGGDEHIPEDGEGDVRNDESQPRLREPGPAGGPPPGEEDMTEPTAAPGPRDAVRSRGSLVDLPRRMRRAFRSLRRPLARSMRRDDECHAWLCRPRGRSRQRGKRCRFHKHPASTVGAWRGRGAVVQRQRANSQGANATGSVFAHLLHWPGLTGRAATL